MPDVTSSSPSWEKGSWPLSPSSEILTVSYQSGWRAGRFVPTLHIGPGKVPSQINSCVSEWAAVVEVLRPVLSVLHRRQITFRWQPQESYRHITFLQRKSGYPLTETWTFLNWGTVFSCWDRWGWKNTQVCLWGGRRREEQACSLPLQFGLQCSLVNKPSSGEPSMQILFPYCVFYKIFYKLVAFVKVLYKLKISPNHL